MLYKRAPCASEPERQSGLRLNRISCLGPRDGDGAADEVMPRTARHPRIHARRQLHRSRAWKVALDHAFNGPSVALLRGQRGQRRDGGAGHRAHVQHIRAHCYPQGVQQHRTGQVAGARMAVRTRLNEVWNKGRSNAMRSRTTAPPTSGAMTIFGAVLPPCSSTPSGPPPLRPRHRRSAGTLTANLLLAGGERSDPIRRRAIIPVTLARIISTDARPHTARAERCAGRVCASGARALRRWHAHEAERMM